MSTRPRANKQRMIGSLIAVILGVLTFVGGLGRLGSAANDAPATGMEGEDAFGPILAGLVMILGAVAYRSRKRRLFGLRPDTRGRLLLEITALAVLTAAWLTLRDLAFYIGEDPVSYLLIPVWALAAYPCAGCLVRPEPSERKPSSREPVWAGGPDSLAIAFALGAAAAVAMHAWRLEPVKSEPARPSQTLLDAVPPLGLAVSMSQPVAIEPSGSDVPSWIVSIECGIAEGEADRLAAPTAAERWLFGVLWGTGSPAPPEPRSYVQAVPLLTLLLSFESSAIRTVPDEDPAAPNWFSRMAAAARRAARRDARTAAAVSAVFPRCPGSTQRLTLPVRRDHAGVLLDASATVSLRVDALGPSP